MADDRWQMVVIRHLPSIIEKAMLLSFAYLNFPYFRA